MLFSFDYKTPIDWKENKFGVSSSAGAKGIYIETLNFCLLDCKVALEISFFSWFFSSLFIFTPLRDSISIP